MFRLLNRSRIYAVAGSRVFPSLHANDAAYLIGNYQLAAKSGAFRSFSWNSSESDQDAKPTRRLLPPLMEMKETIWPSFINSIRGFIFLHFIIRPYLDNEFNVKDFTTGAKQAVHVISTKLANGDWDGLKDLVAEEILPDLRESLSKMNIAQRAEIAIRADDIYLTFPYQVRWGRTFLKSGPVIQ